LGEGKEYIPVSSLPPWGKASEILRVAHLSGYAKNDIIPE